MKIGDIVKKIFLLGACLSFLVCVVEGFIALTLVMESKFPEPLDVLFLAFGLALFFGSLGLFCLSSSMFFSNSNKKGDVENNELDKTA